LFFERFKSLILVFDVVGKMHKTSELFAVGLDNVGV